MRKLLVLFLIVLCHRALAAEQVTASQLGQKIAAATHKSDKQVEKQLSGLVLTERVSPRQLQQWDRMLPGEKSRSALLPIAGASAFLNPPQSEMLTQAAPSPKAQGEMLIRAAQFVAEESRRMPNFLAQRMTTRFQNVKRHRYSQRIEYYTPKTYHLLDRRTVGVRFVDGQEEEIKPNRPPSKKQDVTLLPPGLTTWGAFGSLLPTVTADILLSKVGWVRWERGDTGKLAVFRFAVPQAKSHYTVEYCCIVDAQGAATEFKATPAYHGEITIEPETGHVVRIVLICDLAPKQVITRADVELEYGPVEIAGKSYLLPVRGVSASATPTIQLHKVADRGFVDDKGFVETDRWVVTSINDLRFENYRVFRTEMRILPSEESGDSAEKPEGR